MADVINLRQARKKKARVDKETKAETNRVLFGRTKAQKTLERQALERFEKNLDGKKRED